MNTHKELKKFGSVVGSGFLGIAFFPYLFHHSPIRIWALVISLGLLAVGMTFPKLLSGPYWLWMKIGAILGWINSRILITLIFFLLITPLALFMKLVKRDRLCLRKSPEKKSYAEPSIAKDADHLRLQF